MAGRKVITTLSDMSLGSPRLPNFPLPRELRDQIYGYLLDGEYVRTKRTWNQKEHDDDFDNDRAGPRAYHFNTNILGVNHAIHDEAEELFYKRNVFVVLSYKYFGLGNENGGLFWLPIVSNKHAPRMKEHSVHIHVTPGEAGSRDPMISGNDSLQSVIFLARDLNVFCLIMTTAGTTCTLKGLAVTLDRDGAGVPVIEHSWLSAIPVSEAPQFQCTLRNTKYRQMDAATQRQILAPMSRILAPSQRVTIEGTVCDFQEIELLKRTMSPTLSCVPAFKGRYVEALPLAKDVADAAVLHDDIKFVMALYRTIALTLGVFSFMLEGRQRQRQDFRIACPKIAEACDILALEAWMNAGCCAAKARDHEVLREAGDSIHATIRQIAAENGNRSLRNVPPQLRRLCYSVMLWRNLYCGADGYHATVGEVVEYLTGSERHPHLVHDIEILSRQPDQDAVVTRKHLPFDQCSAVQLPLPITSYHNHLLQQDRSQGWLDMDLLRSLPEGMKRQVNLHQKHYGIKVTDFDELLE